MLNAFFVILGFPPVGFALEVEALLFGFEGLEALLDVPREHLFAAALKRAALCAFVLPDIFPFSSRLMHLL